MKLTRAEKRKATMEERYGPNWAQDWADKAHATMKQNLGEDGYHQLAVRRGQIGGLNSKGGGFATNHDLAVRAGRLGGKASRRRKS